jgi:hypothetical protein
VKLAGFTVKEAAHFRSVQGFCVALSLANLCFLSVWRELLFADTADAYWLPDYTAESYLAAIINVFSLTLILWGMIAFLFHSRAPWLDTFGRLLFLAVLLIPLNYLRLVLGVAENTIHWAKDHWLISMPGGAALTLLALYLLGFYLKQLTQAVALACLVLFPFACLNLVQAAWAAIRLSSPAVAETEAVPRKGEAAVAQRIVWLLMDELDLRLAFLQRPEGLELPEFDRLRNQAFFALNARSYSKNTEEAIPSFLLQKIVDFAKPVGAAELHINFADFENTPDGNFAQFRNFFAEAADAGARIAIIGYYHPYCRLFRQQTEYCSHYALNTFTPVASHSLIIEMWSQVLGVTPLFRRINAIITYLAISNEISLAVADPHHDLVYLHASVPHGPNIWDSKTQSFTLFNTSKEGYFENLILADKLLGQIRGSLEQADLWDRSVVLLTSDHEWRHTYLYDNQRTKKIPFVLKMPDQDTPFDFALDFVPMRITKDLLLRIQLGQITTSVDVASWLEGSLPTPPQLDGPALLATGTDQGKDGTSGKSD